MNKPHQYAELIKMVADGALPQFWYDFEWHDGTLSKLVNELHWTWRAKPAEPEKVYPVTQMVSPELTNAFDANKMLIIALEDVANAAIRHAVDNGYLVTPEQAKEVSAESYNRGLNEGIAEGLKRNADRDMKIARAVGQEVDKHWCDLLQSYVSCHGADDLAAIIAKVPL